MEIEQNQNPPRPRKPGTFQPGHKQHRPKGAVNRVTSQLKAGILAAAVEHGSDGNGKDGLPGYLRHCAKKHPRHFLQLLRTIMPRKISTEAAKAINDMLAPPIPPQPLSAMEKFRRARGLPP